MTHLFRRLVHEESGQDIIEYALVAAGISVLMIPLVPTIGQTLLTVYNGISSAVTGIPVPPG